MIYYIADTHFGHENSIRFDSRPFSSAEEMDRTIIEYWNSRVTGKDDVYILGDFAFKNERPFTWYLSRLSGRKHLIVGNHDTKLLKDTEAMGFFETVEYLTTISDNNERIVLCHYPICEWNGFYHGTWHIYGHIHNDSGSTFQYMSTLERALNAGCMLNNYIPVTFAELVENNRIFRQSRGR